MSHISTPWEQRMLAAPHAVAGRIYRGQPPRNMADFFVPRVPPVGSCTTTIPYVMPLGCGDEGEIYIPAGSRIEYRPGDARIMAIVIVADMHGERWI